jgi:hypothetical protein
VAQKPVVAVTATGTVSPSAIQQAPPETAPAVPASAATTTQAAAAVTPQPPPATEKSEARWPALKLAGVMGKGKTGSAIINGRVVSVGESINDAKVLVVEGQGIRIEFQGEVRYLKVGKTLD